MKLPGTQSACCLQVAAPERPKPPAYTDNVEQWLNDFEDWARASGDRPLVQSIWRLRGDLRRAEGDLIGRIEYLEGEIFELEGQLEELRPKPKKKGDAR